MTDDEKFLWKEGKLEEFRRLARSAFIAGPI